jgi:HSP20 family protein
MSKQESKNIPVTSNNKVTRTTSPTFHPLLEMERAFDRLFDRRWPSLWHARDFSALDNLFEVDGKRMPNLNVVDRDNEIIVKAEVPGLDKKDINVSVNDNLLTIKGQTSKDEKEEKGDYFKREISSSSFARSITLPSAVDTSKTVASLKDGVLEIKLPKTEASKQRSIAVQ